MLCSLIIKNNPLIVIIIFNLQNQASVIVVMKNMAATIGMVRSVQCTPPSA